VCSPDTFNENSNINIKGEMTERGVLVKKVVMTK